MRVLCWPAEAELSRGAAGASRNLCPDDFSWTWLCGGGIVPAADHGLDEGESAAPLSLAMWRGAAGRGSGSLIARMRPPSVGESVNTIVPRPADSDVSVGNTVPRRPALHRRPTSCSSSSGSTARCRRASGPAFARVDEEGSARPQ